MDQPASSAAREPGPSVSATVRSALRSIHLDNLGDVRSSLTLGSKLRTVLHPSTWWDALYLLSKRNLFVAVCAWWFNFLANIVLNLLFSPASVLLDPISTATSLVLYPAIGLVLTVYAVALALARFFGAGDWIVKVGDKWAKGRSVPNWPNPDFLDDAPARRALNEARGFLAGYIPTTIADEVAVDEQNPAFAAYNTVRVFSTVLARALLTLSSIVYERPDEEVDAAANIYYKAKQLHATRQISTAQFERERRRAEAALAESERKIRHLANQCGLEYDGVSDLTTVGGPFASLFFTRPGANEAPFIVLVFKGTGIGNFPEFITDMSFSRVPATSFFGPGAGTAHKGFFTNLFKSDARATGGDGYGSVVQAIKHAAARIKEEREDSENDTIPLWITGHSLGSALALLAYARFLKSPDDLGDDIELRDFYGFGTLRVGDADFVSMFENLTLTPRNLPNIAWRVQNRIDIACNFPFGAADIPQLGSVLSKSSIVNFGHVSASLVVRPIIAVPGSTYRLDKVGSFRGATEVKVVTDALGVHEAKPSDRTRAWWKDSSRLAALYLDPFNPVRWAAAAFGLVAPMIYDHAPWAYMHAINAIGKSTALDPGAEAAERAPGPIQPAPESDDAESAEGFEVVQHALEERFEEAVQEAAEEAVEEAVEMILAAAAAPPPEVVPIVIPVGPWPDGRGRREEGGERREEGERVEKQREEEEVEAAAEGKKEGEEEGAASYPSPPTTGGLSKENEAPKNAAGEDEHRDAGDQQQDEEGQKGDEEKDGGTSSFSAPGGEVV